MPHSHRHRLGDDAENQLHRHDNSKPSRSRCCGNPGLDDASAKRIRYPGFCCSRRAACVLGTVLAIGGMCLILTSTTVVISFPYHFPDSDKTDSRSVMQSLVSHGSDEGFGKLTARNSLAGALSTRVKRLNGFRITRPVSVGPTAASSTGPSVLVVTHPTATSLQTESIPRFPVLHPSMLPDLRSALFSGLPYARRRRFAPRPGDHIILVGRNMQGGEASRSSTDVSTFVDTMEWWERVQRARDPIRTLAAWRPLLPDRGSCGDRFAFVWNAGLFSLCDADQWRTPTGAAARSSFWCRGSDSHSSAMCDARNLMMDTSKVAVSWGGEPAQTVMGREEQAEFPSYSPGAFRVGCKQSVAPADRMVHHMSDMLLRTDFEPPQTAVPLSQPTSCDALIEDTTLFVTRYEYANLFHTLTDWVNTFMVLLNFDMLVLQSAQSSPPNEWSSKSYPVLPLRESSAPLSFDVREPFQILLNDGHAAGALDDSWTDMFGARKVWRISELKQYGRVCFRRALWVTPGYRGPININRLLDACQDEPLVRAFAHFVWQSYTALAQAEPATFVSGIPIQSPPNERLLIFVMREFYLAHPRVRTAGIVERSIANSAQDLLAVLRRVADAVNAALLLVQGPSFVGPTLTLRAELMYSTRQTFRQQLGIIGRTQIMVGLHGAGLSHCVFMPDGGGVLEIRPQLSSRVHFELLSKWRGLHYSQTDAGLGPNAEYGGMLDLGIVERELRALAARSLGITL